MQVSLCLFLLSCLVSDGDDDDANSDFPPPPVRTLLGSSPLRSLHSSLLALRHAGHSLRPFPMLSFAVNVFLLTLSLVVLPRVAGTPQNVTLRLDSPLVSFSSGWRVATFNQTGLDSEFAFANGHNEEVQVLLPREYY